MKATLSLPASVVKETRGKSIINPDYDHMVCIKMNLIDKIEINLPQGYNLRKLELEDYNKGIAI